MTTLEELATLPLRKAIPILVYWSIRYPERIWYDEMLDGRNLLDGRNSRA